MEATFTAPLGSSHAQDGVTRDIHEFSDWATRQYLDKYSWKDENGEPTEVWPDTAWRVVEHNLAALGYGPEDPEFRSLVRLITERKFIPGGRYLAMAGRDFHQVNNCFLYRCDDSREGWADVVRKAVLGLSSGGGIGVVYSDVRPRGSRIAKTGGTATGPLSPAQMVNEVARHVMAGGNRRSAIWGGLHWWHADIFEWIAIKDWSAEIKAAKAQDYNAPAPLDMTNISVILDSEFFLAYHNTQHPRHEHAQRVYWETVKHMLAHGEPGFSINVGDKVNECLRNAPVAGDTHVLTSRGYRPVQDLVGTPTRIWTGQSWAEDVEFQLTHKDAPILAVEMTGGRVIRCEPSHEFLVERHSGAGDQRRLTTIERLAATDLQVGDQLHVAHHVDAADPFDDQYFDRGAYTLGWIYGDGSFAQAGGADLTLCSPESKACLPYLTGYASINEDDGRGYTRLYFAVDDRWRHRDKALFPLDVFTGSFACRRAFIAGLFDADGNWEPTQKRIRLASRHEGFLRDVARVLEAMGIVAHVSKGGHSTYGQRQSYQLVVAAESMRGFANSIPTQRIQPDLKGYKPYRSSAIKVVSVTEDGFEDVYCADVGVPEHSFQAEGVIISNCTEVSSEDDSDVCNLGSINLARIESLDEMAEAVRLGTLFLLAGTEYSDVPHDEVREVRANNRRLGLGLMGVHEWLLVRGYDYSIVPELREWLEVYADGSDTAAEHFAMKHGLNFPKGRRAIAPNGTIGILAETTTSAEPVLYAAYKRWFIDGHDVRRYQYVLDPTVERLRREHGVDPSQIETAHDLAYDPEKRIKFQADLQEYVDHGISSTINLPEPITDPDWVSHYGEVFMKYLPRLRGFTCYPNGARDGQPFDAVPYEEAVGQTGVTFDDDRDGQCASGVCGV